MGEVRRAYKHLTQRLLGGGVAFNRDIRNIECEGVRVM